ncbi:alpha/beta fold hydrolase [Deinococcus altitudinis]|uniref:alpha/beta fold hydrolase n=1 Tax=Deinococcus altitudinis TaxID=468914 RepID=UPI0038912F1E
MTTAPTDVSPPGFHLTVDEAGQGRPALILHGGGGPLTVAGIGAHLSATMHTLIPTHPGWNGTERPAWLTGIDDLALMYLDELSDRGLRDVLVIGSSIGGWIATEMAVRDRAGLISGLILIDAAGVTVEGEPIRDFFALDPRGVAEYAWHDAERYYTDPATVPADQRDRQQANVASMRVVTGGRMDDPKLRRRLSRVQQQTLVLWGESDRLFTPAYGTAYAAAFPNSVFRTIAQAGHLPQLERPAATFALIDDYLQAQTEQEDLN